MTDKHELREAADLNRGFYSSEPKDYFAVRLALLSLMAASTNRYGAEVEAGVTLGPLTVRQARAPGDVQFPDEQVEAYVVAESVIVFHHTAETLMRLLLAHLADRGCPWLEVSMMRTPGEFKRALERIDREPAALPIEDVAWAFFSSDDTPSQDVVPNERWTLAKVSHRALLRAFARVLLIEAPLYNAMKHGLAVQSAYGTMSLGVPGREPVIATDGAWMRVLERERREAEAVWLENTKLVDPRRYWLMTLAGIHMMNALWSVGRARAGLSDVAEPFITSADLNVDELLSFGMPSGFTGMTRTIGVERKPDNLR